VRERLRRVKDPELRHSIVDLHMVRDVRVAGGEVDVDVALTVDAQEGRMLRPGEWVEVAAASARARLVRRQGWNFYEVLRRKLAEDDRLGL
jgi:metal-sulfur cluster biosynthetic enzyme